MHDLGVFQAQAERNIRRLRTATMATYLVAFSLLSLTVSYGLGKLRTAHTNLEQVMAQHSRMVSLLTDTQVASYRRADTVHRLILETDPFRQDEVFMAFLKAGYQVGDGRNQIRALLSSEREKAVLAEQDAIVAEAVILHDQIADLARGGQYEAARAIYTDQVASLHDRGNVTFQALRELQAQAGKKAIAAANETYHDTLRGSVGAVLASLVVSIGVGMMMYRTSNRITDRLRENVVNLRHLAMHDPLTGLPNRSAITQRMRHQLQSSQHFALLYMDLDGFKQVNDTHGHDLGDVLLQMAAARIRSRMRGIDTVARIGGDEFVALMEGISDSEECEHAARHIIEAFAEPFVCEDVRVHVGISIGAVLVPADGRDAAEILNTADRAMYRAKGRGSNCYEFHAFADETALAGAHAG